MNSPPLRPPCPLSNQQRAWSRPQPSPQRHRSRYRRLLAHNTKGHHQFSSSSPPFLDWPWQASSLVCLLAQAEEIPQRSSTAQASAETETSDRSQDRPPCTIQVTKGTAILVPEGSGAGDLSVQAPFELRHKLVRGGDTPEGKSVGQGIHRQIQCNGVSRSGWRRGPFKPVGWERGNPHKSWHSQARTVKRGAVGEARYEESCCA